MPLKLIATCGLGLEEILAAEVRALGCAVALERGAVEFTGSWEDCWRANWRLRTANRVLVELARWPAATGAELAAGARALIQEGAGGARREVPGLERTGPQLGDLLRPEQTFAVQATATASTIRDTRWAALTLKDGLVDGQRERYGRRSDVARDDPDVPLRLRLHQDRATLLLDASGEPLDRRGYRAVSTTAPLREQLAAACVLASGWDGKGPVVDPMCGSGTLLIEAAWIALGWAPGRLRQGWACERLPTFDAAAAARCQAIRAEPLPAPGPGVALYGNERSAEALRAARANLERAGLADRAHLRHGAAEGFHPPALAGGPGLVVVNPPHGERVATDAGEQKALGDLLKQRFRGWKAAVLAGGPDRGKHIGLRPKHRIPVMNGPLEARILVFELY